MFADASLLDEMRKVDVEELLLPLLIQLAIIIAAARRGSARGCSGVSASRPSWARSWRG